MGIANAEGHAAGARSMFLGEVGRLARRLVVQDEIDSALAEQRDLFGAMAGNQTEAHGFEDGLEDAGLRGSEFDELKAVESHGVVAGRGGCHGCHYSFS